MLTGSNLLPITMHVYVCVSAALLLQRSAGCARIVFFLFLLSARVYVSVYVRSGLNAVASIALTCSQLVVQGVDVDIII